MQVFLKDPDAVLDYTMDWGSGYLQSGEAISTSLWTIFPSGMTLNAAGHTASDCTITLQGGICGHIYQLTNRITTSQGRTDERSISVRVEQR